MSKEELAIIHKCCNFYGLPTDLVLTYNRKNNQVPLGIWTSPQIVTAKMLVAYTIYTRAKSKLNIHQHIGKLLSKDRSGIYYYLSEYNKLLQIPNGKLITRINKFFKELDNVDPNYINPIEFKEKPFREKNSHNMKRIEAILPNGEYLEFKSIKDASNQLNISTSSISRCCNYEDTWANSSLGKLKFKFI